MRKYGLNERIVGGLKIRQTPISKSRIDGLMSSPWLEMSTVTNGLLWRYCSASSSTAYMRRQRTLTRFSDDAKSGDVAAVLTGRTSIQKHHDTLEAQAKETFWRFLF